MGLRLGGRRAAFVWLPGFFFLFLFFMLHHPEPNRAMLVGVGGGGWQLLYLASLFRNGIGFYSVITRLQ